MGYSINKFVGDGSTTIFQTNFTKGYFSVDDIKCRVGDEVDGLGDPLYRTITQVPGDPNRFEVSGDPAGVGVEVRFTRTVDKTQLRHDFQDNSPLTEKELDEQGDYILMMLHELFDGVGLTSVEVDIDLQGNKITGISIDTDDDESQATVGYVKDLTGNAPVYAQAASDSADAAASSALAASASEDNALASEVLASDYKDLAEKWATEDEDVVVADGEYSAKHYSIKASNTVDTIDEPTIMRTTGDTKGYLSTELDGGQLDNRYYTETEVETNMESWVKSATNATVSGPIFTLAAFVNFRGSDGAIRDSGNVSSVTDLGTGTYQINAQTSWGAGDGLCVLGTSSGEVDGSVNPRGGVMIVSDPSTTSVKVITARNGDTGVPSALMDCTFNSIAIVAT